jgi:3-deoxy-D-manno-octulosonic-acid transferase
MPPHTRPASSTSWTAVGPLFDLLGRSTRFRLPAPVQALYFLYVVAWHVALPAVFVYFWLRGRREPLYRQYWHERLGRVRGTPLRPVWIHCASLGELRGVMPLIDRFCSEGHALLITTLTPAGREAATSRYAAAIDAGQLAVSYLPLELPWAVRTFAGRVQPRCMMSTEIDTWPVVLHVLRAMHVPCAFANAGYPEKSFQADQRGLRFRASFFAAYQLVLCKSVLHAERFIQSGCERVHAVGEIRFDLPVSPHQLRAAERFRQLLCAQAERPVFALASIVESEEDAIIEAIQRYGAQAQQRLPDRPLWVFVPRSAQRFDEVFRKLELAGLSVARRSASFDAELQAQISERALDAVDVLLGDSFGEMHFYLEMADHVTVGGSFSPKGSHNIIEALALRKPVTVGPVIWTIEYPAQEALTAGVVTQVSSTQNLIEQWRACKRQGSADFSFKIDAFTHEHAHSTDRHWKILHEWLSPQA